MAEVPRDELTSSSSARGWAGRPRAAGLAPPGARILILERGERLLRQPEARDARAIFQRGIFRPPETWLDGAGQAFNPGNYYYVGGNTKLYGAVLHALSRRRISRPWRIATAPRRAGRSHTTSWSPGIRAPRSSTGCAARRDSTRTEPPSFEALSVCARARRAGNREGRATLMKRVGLRPFPLPLASTSTKWLRGGKRPGTPTPTRGRAKSTPRHAPQQARSPTPMSGCVTGRARRPAASWRPDGKRVNGVEASNRRGARERVRADVDAFGRRGELGRAAAGRRHRRRRRANRSDAVGRRFMNHNCTGDAGHRPACRSTGQSTRRRRNQRLLPRRRSRRAAAWQRAAARARHRAGPQAQLSRRAPEWALNRLRRRSVDWYPMSEDLPDPDSRVTVDGGRHPARLAAQQRERGHRGLVERMRGGIARGGLSGRPVEAFSTGGPPRTSAARSASGPTPPPRRWTPSAAPRTTRTFS